MAEPRLTKLKSGWLARGEGWAVRAETKEDAVRLFHETEELYQEIDARPFLYERDKLLNKREDQQYNNTN